METIMREKSPSGEGYQQGEAASYFGSLVTLIILNIEFYDWIGTIYIESARCFWTACIFQQVIIIFEMLKM